MRRGGACFWSEGGLHTLAGRWFWQGLENSLEPTCYDRGSFLHLRGHSRESWRRGEGVFGEKHPDPHEGGV